MRHSGLIAVCIGVLCLGTAARADYVERWNDGAAGADGWCYWDQSNSEPLCAWTASGGQDGGKITVNLSQLGDWGVFAGTTLHDYYPAYTGSPTAVFDVGADPVITVALRDESTTGEPLDLHGGQLHFWIGEAIGDKYTYYSFDVPFDIGPGVWTSTMVGLTADPGNWVLIADNQGKTLTQLLASPQQQGGFHIIGGSAAPQGILSFDNFAAIPEPASLALLGLGGLLVLRRRRRGGKSRAFQPQR